MLTIPISLITEMQAVGIANQEEVDNVTKRITKVLVKDITTENETFKIIAEITEKLTQQRPVS